MQGEVARQGLLAPLLTPVVVLRFLLLFGWHGHRAGGISHVDVQCGRWRLCVRCRGGRWCRMGGNECLHVCLAAASSSILLRCTLPLLACRFRVFFVWFFVLVFRGEDVHEKRSGRWHRARAERGKK